MQKFGVCPQLEHEQAVKKAEADKQRDEANAVRRGSFSGTWTVFGAVLED